MFTGIITQLGTIESVEKRGDMRAVIACDFAGALAIGESVAVNGVCLTVVEKNTGRFSVDISSETLSRSAPRWQKGARVNLERSLKMGDMLSGHLVSGHVDGIASIREIAAAGDSHELCLEVPPELARFIAAKGSVTLDGVSLTVNKVAGRQFWVNIIPHTWQNTTFFERKLGEYMNIEVDLIARYVARLMEK
jgi:riboflavin synthase